MDTIGQKDVKEKSQEDIVHSMFTKEELEKLEQLKSKIANDGILEMGMKLFNSAGWL